MRLSEHQLAEFLLGTMRDSVAHATLAERSPAIAAPRRRRNRPEDVMQRAVCQFWALAYPETWAKTFHPPNGLAAKNPKLAGIFKGLGVKPGVFDLNCIARRGSFNGFALELKDTRGRASDSQNDWAERYLSEGWSVTVAFSLDAALRAIRDYHVLAPRL
jgi:hypothetical protein